MFGLTFAAILVIACASTEIETASLRSNSQQLAASKYFTYRGCGTAGFTTSMVIGRVVGTCFMDFDNRFKIIRESTKPKLVGLINYVLEDYGTVDCTTLVTSNEVTGSEFCTLSGTHARIAFTNDMPVIRGKVTMMKTYNSNGCPESSFSKFEFANLGSCYNARYKFARRLTSSTLMTYSDAIPGCIGSVLSNLTQNTFECNNKIAFLNTDNTPAVPECFAGSEQVEKQDGTLAPISSITVGDFILSSSASGELKYAEVVAVPHAQNEIESAFVNIVTSTGEIKVTPNHIVLAGACSSEMTVTMASEVRVGDCMKTSASVSEVVSVETSKGRGLYSVVTTEEFIVVNGFVASPFATNHFAANSYYNVYRVIYSLFPAMMKNTIPARVNELFGAAVSLLSV